ncbi:MAG: hypothetical protein ACOH15_11485 [Acetobacterium sp.]
MEKNEYKEIIEELWEEHKGMLFLMFISIAIIVVYQLTYELPEAFYGAERLFGMLFTLAGGYVINFLFFYLQIFIPNRKMRLRSFEFIKYHLTDIQNYLLKIQTIFDCLDEPSPEKNRMMMKKEVSYYVKTNRCEAYETFKFKEDMKSIKNRVEADLNYIFGHYYFQYCDNNIIWQLNKLKASVFFETIIQLEMQQNNLIEEFMLKSLKIELEELNQILYELLLFLGKNKVEGAIEETYRMLTVEEQEDFTRMCEVYKIAIDGEEITYIPNRIIVSNNN